MKIDRLLSMILLMLQKKKITASEMASYFETSLRTIYRDMDTLGLAGIPIASETGANGGYSLMEGFTLDRQVFKVDEMLTLIAGLKGLEDVIDSRAVRQTLEKVASLGEAGPGSPSLEIDFFGWGEGNRIRHNVQILNSSISAKHCIRFTYTNLNNETLNRTSEPLKLFFRGSNWYLLAYCRNRQDYRFFRVSRMLDMEVMEETFVHPEGEIPDWDPNHPAGTLRPTENLHLLISSGGASRAREFFSSENLTEKKDGSVEVKVSYPPDEWVYSYLMGFGQHLTVLAPVRLRKELIRRASDFLEKNETLTD